MNLRSYQLDSTFATVRQVWNRCMWNGSIHLGCSFVLSNNNHRSCNFEPLGLKKVTNTIQYISLLDVLQKCTSISWYDIQKRLQNYSVILLQSGAVSGCKLQESLRRRGSKERGTTDWCQMSLWSSQLWALYERVKFACIWPLSTCWVQDDRFA